MIAVIAILALIAGVATIAYSDYKHSRGGKSVLSDDKWTFSRKGWQDQGKVGQFINKEDGQWYHSSCGVCHSWLHVVIKKSDGSYHQACPKCLAICKDPDPEEEQLKRIKDSGYFEKGSE